MESKKVVDVRTGKAEERLLTSREAADLATLRAAERKPTAEERLNSEGDQPLRQALIKAGVLTAKQITDEQGP